MADTYTQINIHLVFAVKHRECIINKTFRDQLHKYIHGILQNQKQFTLAVNGSLDHIHAFFELNPKNSISEIARIVKSNSSKWINEMKFLPGKFEWQEGYGAFSYSRSQRNEVINYIINQEEHHKKRTFKEEYLEILNKFEIEYKPEYLFDFFD